MKIVCFGDSITEAGVGGWTCWLQQQLGAEHQVVNSGVGANTTMHAMDRFATDVLAHEPDIVLIEFGINDAYVYVHQTISRHSVSEYERNMREILRMTRQAGARPVLVINHFPLTNGLQHEQGNGIPIERNMDAYNQVLRDLAAELAVDTIDFPVALSEEDVAGMLDEDLLHISEFGQEKYGRVVLDGLAPLVLDACPA